MRREVLNKDPCILKPVETVGLPRAQPTAIKMEEGKFVEKSASLKSLPKKPSVKCKSSRKRECSMYIPQLNFATSESYGLVKYCH